MLAGSGEGPSTGTAAPNAAHADTDPEEIRRRIFSGPVTLAPKWRELLYRDMVHGVWDDDFDLNHFIQIAQALLDGGEDEWR